MPPPELSIVIPAYGQAELTSRCIDSLLKLPPDLPFEIIVVDDASEPPLVDLLQADPHLRVLRNAQNSGFACSCNIGARAAQGRLVLLLNNDTEVLPGWWQPLQAAIEGHADYGIVVPKLIFPDRTIQHCGKVWKDTEVPNGSAQHIYYKLPADAPCVNRSRVYGIVTGAALLVRRDEFLALGGFDEQYHNGWEDDDLCYAYRAQGLGSYYCAESEIVHHQSQTLNRELRNLEQSVADSGELARLNERLQDGTASLEERQAAGRNLAAMEQLEATMDRFRQQYLHNRQHFFSKWGDLVQRDDWRYYQADGFTTDPDIPRFPAHLQQRLGRPFEQDPACGGTAEVSRQQGVVSIIILTWNQLDYTRQCLHSIQQFTAEPHEIIFVDNGSTDGTVAWLQQQVAVHDNYRLISNRQNLGFAKGCNQGIEAATGAYLLLLNNDVVVTEGWLAGLLECLCSSASIGIVGPMTNNISGLQRVAQVGYHQLEDLHAYAAEYRSRYRHRRIPQRRIVGFCMLFRSELVSKIGLLDEQFGSGNFEDDDYCIRAALAGYQNMIAGDVFIHHYGSVSFQGNQCNYAATMQGNNALFRTKWSRPLQGDQAVAAQVLKVLEKAELLYQRQEYEQLIETVLQEGIRYAHDESRLYYTLASYLLDGRAAKRVATALLDLVAGKLDSAQLSKQFALLIKTPVHYPLAQLLFELGNLQLQHPGVEFQLVVWGIQKPSINLPVVLEWLPQNCTFSDALQTIIRLSSAQFLAVLDAGHLLPEKGLQALSNYFRWDKDMAMMRGLTVNDPYKRLLQMINPAWSGLPLADVALFLQAALTGQSAEMHHVATGCCMIKRELVAKALATNNSLANLEQLRLMLGKDGKSGIALDSMVRPTDEMAQLLPRLAEVLDSYQKNPDNSRLLHTFLSLLIHINRHTDAKMVWQAAPAKAAEVLKPVWSWLER